jgi:hypothetical protein
LIFKPHTVRHFVEEHGGAHELLDSALAQLCQILVPTLRPATRAPIVRLYKTELIRRYRPWRSLVQVETPLLREIIQLLGGRGGPTNS